jgi:hypothetical protein
VQRLRDQGSKRANSSRQIVLTTTPKSCADLAATGSPGVVSRTHPWLGSGSRSAFSSNAAGRPCSFQWACMVACCLRAPSSPQMRIGADMQRLHRGCSVKYGATSQLAWKAASALSKVSVCPQQRHVYVGIFQDGETPFSIQRRAVAPISIMREHLGASRLRSQTRRWRGLDPPDALPGDQLLPERRLVLTGIPFIPAARPGSSAQ